jgi:conjugative relaxase-like TrwC/TraI family protein
LVLRIAKLGAGGEGYYLRSVGPEPPGSWLGMGPPGVGLSGEVGGTELEALLQGRDPRSGEVLGSARNRVKVTGFDLTFASPKSVSILYALSDQPVSEAVADSHRAAVAAAVDYAENRALGVRRTQGSQRLVHPVEGIFGAAFVHRTSRALDPHLHSHVVVANLGRGPDDRFSALDGRGIYAHAGAIGAVYHAQLRHEMVERLGVEWGPLDRGRADLTGISVEARRGFSTRSAQIAADLGETGLAGGRAAEFAALKTRQPKDPTIDPEDLRPGWRKRAVDLGLGPARIESVLDRVVSRDRSVRDEIGRACDDERVETRLAEKGLPIARRHVVQALCMELSNGAPSSEVSRGSDSVLSNLERNIRVGAREEQTRDGPGVTERRLPLEQLELGPLARRAAAIALERRALAVGRERGRGQEIGIGLEIGF